MKALKYLFLCSLLTFPVRVFAINHQLRTYATLKVDTTLLPKSYKLETFTKLEERFQAGSLVYDKAFLGLTQHITRFFMFRAYWVHKDLLKSKPVPKTMWVGEFFALYKAGPVKFIYRNGNEWHFTDHFYRNREKLELRFYMMKRLLYAWCSEEFRVDSDEGKVSMNDLWMGLGTTIKSHISMRFFYGIEGKRRHSATWSRTDFAGLSVAISL